MRQRFVVLGIFIVVGYGCGGRNLEWVPAIQSFDSLELPVSVSLLRRSGDCLWGYSPDGHILRIATPLFPCRENNSVFSPHWIPDPDLQVSTPPIILGWQDDRWAEAQGFQPWKGSLFLVSGNEEYQINQANGMIIHHETLSGTLLSASSGEPPWRIDPESSMVCRYPQGECWGEINPLRFTEFVALRPPLWCEMDTAVRESRHVMDIRCRYLAQDRCAPRQSFTATWNVLDRSESLTKNIIPPMQGIVVGEESLWIWYDRRFSRWDLRLKKKWQMDLGARPSIPPLEDKRRVIVPLMSRLVFGLDKKSGYRRWAFAVKEPIVQAVPVSKGSISYQLLALVGVDGSAQVIRTDTGQIIWKADPVRIWSVIQVGDHLLWPTRDGSLLVSRITWSQQVRQRAQRSIGSIPQRSAPREVRPIIR